MVSAYSVMLKITSLQRVLSLGILTTMVALTLLPTQAQSPPNLENITLGPRFSPNPLELRGSAGGSAPINEVIKRSDTPTGSCTGFGTSRPNHTIVLTEFFDSLSLQVESSADTSIAVQGPGGIWCNDDFNGKNPGVSGQWLAGTYRIWVSAYGRNQRPAYVLKIKESR